MNIVVYCGSTAGDDPVYAETAAALGRRIADEGHTLVYGGGYVGLMGAVSDAALERGGKVIGVIPEFMFERDWENPRVSEMLVTKDMHERKRTMLELGDVYVALPGGTGTFEEIAEAMAWTGLGLLDGRCFFLNINGYYDGMEMQIEAMYSKKFVRQDNATDASFVRTVDELFEAI